MTKYYKVIKENFLWDVGAIICDEKHNDQFKPLDEQTIWDKTEFNDSEYISGRIVKNCPEYFAEVYKVNLLTKSVYLAKEEAKQIIQKSYYE